MTALKRFLGSRNYCPGLLSPKLVALTDRSVQASVGFVSKLLSGKTDFPVRVELNL